MSLPSGPGSTFASVWNASTWRFERSFGAMWGCRGGCGTKTGFCVAGAPTNAGASSASFPSGIGVAALAALARRQKADSRKQRWRFMRRGLCGFELRVARHELRVAPVLGEELLVCGALGDRALVEDDDLVGVPDGGQTVGDRDGRATLGQAVERRLDVALG